jgi:hypothetical protein
MPAQLLKHCETIEECYEFTLSYAAQGHASDRASAQGRLLRDHLARALDAIRNLEPACAAALGSSSLQPAAPYEAFFAVLARDARDSAAAVELVLAQPSIGSQLIDNLNASTHLRALLTGLFLVAEIFEAQQTREAGEQHEIG